ncbi:MAG: hypothetical protein JKY12_04590 [Sneathiella sp.]|nr:hypothetical protein [Sneathiella sp.]
MMTRFLVTEDNPDGQKLESVLDQIRAEMILRCTFILEDARPEAKAVLANNMKILGLLTDAIDIADDSTRVLDKAFGPSQAAKGGPPRIGS